jgi:hypothetical protein
VFLTDLPLLPITEISRKPERWERVGAYAIFDEDRTLQYVGYTKNVLTKLELHRKLQPSLCRYFKVFLPPPGTMQSEPDALESVLCDWIQENGRVPTGNYQPERWERSPKSKASPQTGKSSTKTARESDGTVTSSNPFRVGSFRNTTDASPRAKEPFAQYRSERATAFYEEDGADVYEFDDWRLRQQGNDWWNRLVRVFSGPNVPLPTGTLADESVRIRVLDNEGNIRNERPLVETEPPLDDDRFGGNRRQWERGPRATRPTRDPYLDQVMQLEREEAGQRAARSERRSVTAGNDTASGRYRTRSRQIDSDDDELVDDWDDIYTDNGLQDWIPFLALGGLAVFLYLLSSMTNGGAAVPPESLGF